jgi:short-subunit dehydrogenase
VSQGATLALVSRRPAAIGAFSGKSYPADVTDARAMAAVAEDFGVPDLVIANAGVSAGTSGEDLRDVEHLRRLLEVNVAGVAITLAAFAPAMRRAGHGTLACIASVAGFRGLAGNGAYSASKAAALTWMESLRTEMRGSGVAVVSICPGYIDTPMTRVNRFRMPFLLPADEAARRIARAIARKPRVAVVPWQMALVSVALRAMPGWLFERLAAAAPRKPRSSSP